MSIVRRFIRVIVISVLVLVTLAGLGIVGATVWAKDQAGEGVTYAQLIPIVASTVFGMAKCAIVECKPDAGEGFTIASWSPPALTASTPVAIEVDEFGRVYVAEGDRVFGGAEDNRRHDDRWLLDDLASRSIEDRDAYYQKYIDDGTVPAETFTARSDHLTVYLDTDGDDVADERRVIASFNERLDGIAAGVLARNGTVWMTEIPGVYRFDDTDGDGIADAKSTLSRGYGVTTSLQGHDLHGLVWGPDGRIYFSMGDRGYRVKTPDGRVLKDAMGGGRGAVFRMQPDGSELEIFATGVRNPQELAFDAYGNLFTGDNNGDGGDKARIVYLVEGGETGWAMPYQTLVGDYIRGPWVAERLWDTHHETQPAWVVPPVAHLADGPSGLAHYPGLGLPERYDGHFFLGDYKYQAAISGVWSFALEPSGAGFTMKDEHLFLRDVIPTDVTFGYDGRVYVSHFNQFAGGQEIVTVRHEDAAGDPRIAEVVALVQGGLEAKSDAELVPLLGHADQRVRLRAQFALAEREAVEELGAAFADSEAELLQRLHALWGLGQLGAPALQAAGIEDTAAFEGEAEEIRAQLAKVAGETKATWLAEGLIPWLDESSPRVRFFAAQALGALGHAGAVDALYGLVGRTADRDPWLRHAAVYALHRIGDREAAAARVADDDRAVRLAVLLQFRRSNDPAIAAFLSDEDPLLVVEAARAIYDRPIAGAMGALADLAGTVLPFLDDDPQTSHALHRRVIGAARNAGTEGAALAIAAHAADEDNPKAMRALALETLGEFAAPGPRDLAMGWFRPQTKRPPSVVHAALDTHGPALVAGPFADRALEIATAVGRVPLADDALVSLIADPSKDGAQRAAALGALAGRQGAGLPAAIETALNSDSATLRIAARDALAATDPVRALASLKGLGSGATTAERQRAITLAGMLAPHGGAGLLKRDVAAWEKGTLPAALKLELLGAVREAGNPALVGRVNALTSTGDLVTDRAWALAGGDPVAGKAVFESNGDCRRCHGGGGHGASAGPDLAGIAERRNAAYILESVLLPQAELAFGFATVTVTQVGGAPVTGTLVSDGDPLVLKVGDEEVQIARRTIATRSEPASAMPPMGLTLSPDDLRDLVAYVSTL